MSRPPFGTRANDSIARSKEGSHLQAFDAVTLRPRSGYPIAQNKICRARWRSQIPQAAQAEREHGLPQLRRRDDVAAPLVEGDADLEPVVTHWYLAHRP